MFVPCLHGFTLFPTIPKKTCKWIGLEIPHCSWLCSIYRIHQHTHVLQYFWPWWKFPCCIAKPTYRSAYSWQVFSDTIFVAKCSLGDRLIDRSAIHYDDKLCSVKFIIIYHAVQKNTPGCKWFSCVVWIVLRSEQ